MANNTNQTQSFDEARMRRLHIKLIFDVEDEKARGGNPTYLQEMLKSVEMGLTQFRTERNPNTEGTGNPSFTSAPTTIVPPGSTSNRSTTQNGGTPRQSPSSATQRPSRKSKAALRRLSDDTSSDDEFEGDEAVVKDANERWMRQRSRITSRLDQSQHDGLNDKDDRSSCQGQVGNHPVSEPRRDPRSRL